MPGWKILAVFPLALTLWSQLPNDRDRRIVDTVIAGDAESEYHHGYAGYADSAWTQDGRTFRHTRGWMRYAMNAFDDTPVTVACTFAADRAGEFELVVEDSLVATKSLTASSAESVVIEVAVPFIVTKGRANIAVTIRSKQGATPALRELRIIQDHHEQEPMMQHSFLEFPPFSAAPFPKSQIPMGVAR